MTRLLHLSNFDMHWSSRAHDVFAAAMGLSSVAVSNVSSIEQWLKIVMIICTIVFVVLGCVMRVLKIRSGKLDDDG